MTEIYPQTNSHGKEIMKWVLMPFGTILGSVLGSLALVLVLWIGMKISGQMTEDGWYFRYILPFMSSCVVGYLWGYISGTLAPRGKFITSTVMVTILCILMVILVVLTWILHGIPVSNAIQSTVGCIGTVISAIVSVFVIKEEYENS